MSCLHETSVLPVWVLLFVMFQVCSQMQFLLDPGGKEQKHFRCRKTHYCTVCPLDKGNFAIIYRTECKAPRVSMDKTGTHSSCLCTFILLCFYVFQLRSQNNAARSCGQGKCGDCVEVSVSQPEKGQQLTSEIQLYVIMASSVICRQRCTSNKV